MIMFNPWGKTNNYFRDFYVRLFHMYIFIKTIMILSVN